MREMIVRGIPYSLMTDGWWLTDGPGDGGGETGPLARSGGGHGPRIALLAALIFWADFLFWDETPGLSVALFGLTLLTAIFCLFPRCPRPGLAWGAGLLGLLPVVENLSLLSFLIAFAGPLCFACLLRLPRPALAERLIAAAARLWLTLSWFSAWSAATELPAAVRGCGGAGASQRLARAWALPVAAGLLFVALFADANPILSNALSRTFGFDWLTGETVGRAIFWSLVAYSVWPFLSLDRLGWLSVPGLSVPTGYAAGPAWRPSTVNAASVSNSLGLFNLLFAVQSLSDLLYLWSGAPLPDGMSLAEYAHRGAYPLVATALLAGLFALIARPFIQANRRLVILLGFWLGQNLLLVASSLHRLDLYVGVYGLTYLRIAAFIWMGLVAGGLGLIFWQIAGQKRNGWLIVGTATMAAVTLYACCFINFADMIARRNIALVIEHPHRGLDCGYLFSLGEPAIPARRENWATVSAHCDGWYDFGPEPQGWKEWGFRSWRVRRYLSGL